MYKREHWGRTNFTASSIENLIDKEIEYNSRNYDGGKLEDLQTEITAIREVVCKLAMLFTEAQILTLFPEWSIDNGKSD